MNKGKCLSQPLSPQAVGMGNEVFPLLQGGSRAAQVLFCFLIWFLLQGPVPFLPPRQVRKLSLAWDTFQGDSGASPGDCRKLFVAGLTWGWPPFLWGILSHLLCSSRQKLAPGKSRGDCTAWPFTFGNTCGHWFAYCQCKAKVKGALPAPSTAGRN